MQKIQHTALPWTAEKLGSIVGGDAEQYVNGSKQKQLAMVTANFGSDQQQANAAYIVRACNVHYELLEALKAVQLFHYGCNWHHEDDCSLSCGGPVCDCGCDLVKEAIRKADSE